LQGIHFESPFFVPDLRTTITILIFLCSMETTIGQHFAITDECRTAYGQLLDLEFAKAEVTLQKIKEADSENLMAAYLDDLQDFLFIVVTEDEDEYEKRKDLRSGRINRLEKGPSESPYRLLSIGEVHLHWAFSMMRFGDYLSGARQINKAFHVLEKNVELYPDFLPTYKSMGLLHTLIGTVPDNYRWATRLMGVDGTIEQGIGEMEMVVEKSIGNTKLDNLRKETLFLLSFLHLNLLNDEKALSRIGSFLNAEHGPLMDFAKASVTKKAGRSDEAIEIIETSILQRPDAFPYLHFLLGELKLARMDADADRSLEYYIKTFRGKSYLKSAKQKLAWHALLVASDKTKYEKWIARIPENGSTMLDEDKAAQAEFESGIVPNQTLLKARLQFDGGYYEEALKTLVNSDNKAIETAEEELEFTYRIGRIHNSWGHLQEAIRYYEMTISKGSNSKRYYAANASLQLGMIYESLGQNDKALTAFRKCSSFNNSEYKNSINQKAKAGIDRVTD